MPLITAKMGISPSVLNKGFIFVDTGENIAALGPTAGPVVAVCTVSGSTFLADHVYFRKVGGTWQVLNLSKHDHGEDDDDSGGLYSNILYANSNLYYQIRYGGPFYPMMYNQVQGSGASVGLDEAVGITLLKTGAIATSNANSKTGWMGHDWGRPSRFDIKLRVDSSTQVIARAGVNVEALGEGNSTGSKYGIEFCDSTGPNWQIASADSTTRSLLGTTAPGSTAGEQNYRLEHIPGAAGVGAVKLTVGLTGTSPFWMKTSNPPQASGNSDPTKTVSFGIKTQDTNVKNMQVYGFCFIGIPLF